MNPLLLFLSLWLIIAGCKNHVKEDIENILEKRGELISTFNRKTIFRTRTGNFIFLHTHSDNKRNDYVFIQHNGSFALDRDSIMFMPDTVLGINKSELSYLEYNRKLVDTLNALCAKMDLLHISDISSDFSRHGIDLKIYLKPQGIVAYVSDKQHVVNSEWKNYLSSMEKFDDHWYYKKDKEINK